MNVDAAINAVGGPDAFYLSGLMSGRDYFWSVRDPAGRWQAGRVSMAEGDRSTTAVEALLRALPTRMIDEPEIAYRRRVARSPLFGKNSAVTRQAESALLTAAGEALIPSCLWQALRTRCTSAGQRPRLIVSMTGVLAAVPVAFLGASAEGDDLRLVELANVQLFPSIQLSAHVPSRPPQTAGGWPVRAVGAFALKGVAAVASPPWASDVVDQSVPDEDRKQRLLEAFTEHIAWDLRRPRT